MGEQIGTKLQGSTTSKELFKSAIGPNDVIACVIPGGSAATYPMGAAMIDSATSGLKKRYTNADSLTGDVNPCVLMQAVTTTVAGGNVTADAARDGNVDTALVVDANGALVDAGFKAALPKMNFD